MIRLKDLLKEFEYGNLLWADPSANSDSARYKDFIDKAYNGKIETDSKEEREMWLALKQYLRYYEKPNPKLIDTLLALKKKFPSMLDTSTVINSSNQIYRGMTADINDLLEVIKEASSIEKSESTSYSKDYYRLTGINRTVKSRSEHFISVTYNLETAAFFANLSYNKNKDRWRIITSTPYSKVENRSLFNPEFLNAVSGLNEEEFWVIGSEIPVTELYIKRPTADAIASNEDVRELDSALNAKLES